MDKELKRRLYAIVFVVTGVAAMHIAFAIITGMSIFDVNIRNTYTLQALAWLDGRLDLPKDVEGLELAHFGGKVYVSFPPFPSYVTLPFAALFGKSTPDALIAFVSLLLGSAYAVLILLELEIREEIAVFFTLFLFLGSNIWQVTVDGAVWFLAQNLSLTFTLMAIYYAVRGNKGRSAFFIACAIGCRPFQAIYIPLLIFIIVRNMRGKTSKKLGEFFLNRFYVYLPAIAVIASYAVLNYLRFGNIFEFGHTYLPEFQTSDYGQFSLHYFWGNFQNLFRFYKTTYVGTKVFPIDNGSNIFISMPITAVFIYILIKKQILKKPVEARLLLFGGFSVIIHLLSFTMHKTMGGVHFGNRYVIDTLPVIFLMLGSVLTPEMSMGYEMQETEAAIKEKKRIRIDTMIFILIMLYGIIINMVGTWWYFFGDWAERPF